MTYIKLSSFETTRLSQDKTCKLIRTNSKALGDYLRDCHVPVYGRGRGCSIWGHTPKDTITATVQYYHSNTKVTVKILHVSYSYEYNRQTMKSGYKWEIDVELLEQQPDTAMQGKE